MKTGKLSQSIYERSVLKQFHKEQITNFKSAGNVCAFLSIMSETETFALLHEKVAAYTVAMAANALVAKGGIPKAATISLILTTRQSEAFLKRAMKEVSYALEQYHMILLGCNVEIIDAVTAPMAVVTVVGAKAEDKEQNCIQANQDIVMTKYLGLGATAVLANVKEEVILNKYARHLLEKAKSAEEMFNVTAEAATAMKSGVSGMCHINKGGVFGALWEMADFAGVGLIIELKKIPVKQETIEICEIFDVNPYEILGTGSLLIACDDGHSLVRVLGEQGIDAVVIGKTTDNNDRIIMNDGESRFLEPAKPDELIKIL